MSAIDKIRAALEQARELIPEYCGIRTQYDEAFTDIAELETEMAGLNQRNANLQFMLGEVAAERDQLRARLAAIDAQPTVAHMRRWEYDGIEPTKERNANGRMAWPVRFKILPVTSSIRSANRKANGIFADDVELIARPEAK
jgi:hypothetical protein